MRRRRRNVDVDAGVAVGIAVKCLCVYCVCCSVCPFVVGVDKHWLLGIEIGQGSNRVKAEGRYSRLVIVCTKRGSRLWCFRLRQAAKRSWLESSVLIRLTRGIALMRTSRHSTHNAQSLTIVSLPLTPLSYLPPLYFHSALHCDLVLDIPCWPRRIVLRLISFFFPCVTSGLLIQVSPPIWRASTSSPEPFVINAPRCCAIKSISKCF